MALFKRKTPLDREWERLEKKERKFLQKRAGKKERTIDTLLAQKVPGRLQDTLDTAFLKAFIFIFDKGTGVIEKTYRKEKLEREHMADRYIDELQRTKKTLRAPLRKAARTGKENMLLSGAAGIGMGVFGVALPDIPLFTAQLLRNLYEIALRYGYGYENEQERCFILMLIRGSLAYGDALYEINACVDRFIAGTGQEMQSAVEIKAAAATLSRELLCMKFLQGIPIVGVVGGMYDFAYMKRVSEYAVLKYHRRYLHDQRSKQKR